MPASRGRPTFAGPCDDRAYGRVVPSDVLSLKLPALHSRSRRRVRRPRGRSSWEIYWAAATAYAIVNTAMDIALGRPMHASFGTVLVIVYWSEWRGARGGPPGLLRLTPPAVWALFCVLWYGLLIVGVG